MFDADVNRETLPDFDRGVLVGLIVTDGSFTGDGKTASLSFTMHVRHEKLLRWAQDRIDGSKLYGPYSNGVRNYLRLVVRGRALAAFLAIVEDDLALCDYAVERVEAMREKYPLTAERF